MEAEDLVPGVHFDKKVDGQTSRRTLSKQDQFNPFVRDIVG